MAAPGVRLRLPAGELHRDVIAGGELDDLAGDARAVLHREGVGRGRRGGGRLGGGHAGHEHQQGERRDGNRRGARAPSPDCRDGDGEEQDERHVLRRAEAGVDAAVGVGAEVLEREAAGGVDGDPHGEGAAVALRAAQEDRERERERGEAEQRLVELRRVDRQAEGPLGHPPGRRVRVRGEAARREADAPRQRGGASVVAPLEEAADADEGEREAHRDDGPVEEPEHRAATAEVERRRDERREQPAVGRAAREHDGRRRTERDGHRQRAQPLEDEPARERRRVREEQRARLHRRVLAVAAHDAQREDGAQDGGEPDHHRVVGRQPARDPVAR